MEDYDYLIIKKEKGDISFLFLYNKKNIAHINLGDIMEKKLYNKIVMNHKPKENRLRNAIISFIVGGLMGILGHFLLN